MHWDLICLKLQQQSGLNIQVKKIIWVNYFWLDYLCMNTETFKCLDDKANKWMWHGIVVVVRFGY
jgi:hypothetical protein